MYEHRISNMKPNGCDIRYDENDIYDKAILKKMSVGGNISDKKVNRKEGNFYFF